ncbi:MAG: proline--tRNA ligase [Rickettsiales bacterium]|nr:proline--tRNA ligase [Rickettsiales bacterium]
MRISNYFIPALKNDPADASLVSHKLMLRSGMIRQQNSGIYVWLPLGLRVLKKIEEIVRTEMNKSGAIEVLMPCIQPETLWQESGRAESYGKELLRILDRHENKLLFGPTNEEVITDLFRGNIKSYKALPKNFYQIQWKFRDEIRPRFGLLRCREFYMKDAYSFDLDKESAEQTYNKMFETYINIFRKIGLSIIPARAPSGPIGGDLTHEFHVMANEGESEITYDSVIEEELKKENPDIQKIRQTYSVTDEILTDETSSKDKATLKKHKSIELGHIFYSGTKYTEAMNVTVTNKEGKQIFPHCGCYGIGISRIAAAVIEASHDKQGMIWSKAISPFQVALIDLHAKSEDCCKIAEKIYNQFEKAKIEVLYDDSSSSPGSKLALHNLIGIPWQVIISDRLIKENVVEIKNRETQEINKFSYEDAIAFIKKEYDVFKH